MIRVISVLWPSSRDRYPMTFTGRKCLDLVTARRVWRCERMRGGWKGAGGEEEPARGRMHLMPLCFTSQGQPHLCSSFDEVALIPLKQSGVSLNSHQFPFLFPQMKNNPGGKTASLLRFRCRRSSKRNKNFKKQHFTAAILETCRQHKTNCCQLSQSDLLQHGNAHFGAVKAAN